MMSLNGWMRIGIVLSVTWTVVGAYMTYEGLSSLYGKRTFVVGRKGVGEVNVNFSKAQDVDESKSLVNNKWIPAIESEPDKYIGREITEPYDKFVAKHSRKTIVGYIALVFLPSIFLFIGGWSVFWIRRGFTQSALPKS